MEEMFLASKSTQTSDILTARDAKMKLRLDDAQLAELISQLESEKLAAQADYKFAVVQVETRMKIEKAAEIRRVREEKLREIESLSRTHNQQLLAMDEEYERALTSANESGSHLKLEMVKVTDELEQAKRQIETLTSESKTTHDALIQLREEKVVREKLLKTQKAAEHAIKRDEATFSEMKKRLSLLEELNEIILGEYRVLEKARNDLIYAINHKMPEPSPDLLAPYEKSTNLAQQLDEARGRHRKWQK
uniref:Coiled-coil domain-containing protein 176 n=1 Tax=Panagrellus redivivus TaxID=6233 RepID=A0A7E4VX45_PANRE